MIRGTFLVLLLTSTWGATACASDNPIFDELTTRGVAIGNTTIRLPAPILRDGLSPAEQQKALAQIADANHPLATLTRKSVVAPQVLQIKDEPQTNSARPRRVDLYFVAYGNIDRLSDEDFLRQQAAEEAKETPQKAGDEGRILTEQELRARGIQARQGESYGAGRFTLFDRVTISGVVRSQLTRNAESVIAAGMLDPRFANDAEFPNGWRAVTRDEAGRTRSGPQNSYTGVAWYAKATKLHEPAGAVLIELHGVFDEPTGWFDGANLLRSKLPILVQDNVRKFRRRLAAAE